MANTCNFSNIFVSPHCLAKHDVSAGLPQPFSSKQQKRKKKMPTFLNLLVLFLELSGRCGASSHRSCRNVVLCQTVCWCGETNILAMNTQQEPTLKRVTFVCSQVLQKVYFVHILVLKALRARLSFSAFSFSLCFVFFFLLAGQSWFDALFVGYRVFWGMYFFDQFLSRVFYLFIKCAAYGTHQK